jgi:hypothetical protein
MHDLVAANNIELVGSVLNAQFFVGSDRSASRVALPRLPAFLLERNLKPAQARPQYSEFEIAININ